ncbi:MAG TPA: VOC family protein [Chthoniobacteraceae bacterium]|nr:VOC family protein [Chthoniobacteraceae bacterium]
MASSVKPLPDGYHTVTPYLIIHGAAQALEFYSRVFGAVEVMRFKGPGGKIMHAEMTIGDSRIMVADEFPQMGAVSPQSIGGTAVGLALYVEDADATFNRALGAGATVISAVQDQFYGDRSGTLLDPFGHRWTVATHIEDVTLEEVERRAAAQMPH